MYRTAILTLSLAALAGCYAAEPSGTLTDSPVPLRSGTSFGMCLGYCVTELEVFPREVVLTRTSPRDTAGFPTRVERLPLSAAEHAEIMKLLDVSTMLRLDEVYGCPDCADGGAEWVEIETGGRVKRVTLEYGGSVRGITPLLEKLRGLRARFPEPPRG